MFTQNITKIDRPLEEAHTNEGHFYKHTKTGETYTSITTLFKMFRDMSWYQFWVDSIMRKMNMTEEEARVECKRIGDESMRVGTEMHDLAEQYLKNELDEENLQQYSNHWEKNPMELFELLKVWLDENIKEVHATEGSMYSDELKLAGTVDLIATLKDGKKYVIDFKNSRKPKMPGDIKKNYYYEQMCAYGKMWEFCTGEKIEEGIVLVVSWDNKVRPFKVKLADYESNLWDWVLKLEQDKCLNTT